MATKKGVQIPITADGAQANAILDEVRAKLRQTGTDGKKAGVDIADGMEVAASALQALGITVSIVAATNALKSMVTTSLDLGQELERASQKTGLSVETLSTLHYAAAITGTEFETLTSAVAKMDKTIGQATEGNVKAQAFMHALGLNAVDLANRSDGAEVAFKRFAQTLASTESPIRRAELATSLLGKAGAEQIPVLLEIGNNWDYFAKRAEAAGVALNAQTAAALADTNARLHDLQQRILGAAIAFTEGLSPSLNQAFGIISSGDGQMNALVEWGQLVGKSFDYAASAAYGLASGAESAFAISEAALGQFAAAGRDLAAAQELSKKAEQFRDAAQAKTQPKSDTPFIPTTGVPKGTGGFEGVGDLTKHKYDDAIAKAEAALQQSNEEQIAAIVKASNDEALAANEAWHKLMLISDEEYFAQKLALQESNLDAQESAIKARIATLADLEAKQHSDSQKGDKPQRDKAAAEALTTQREIVALNTQLVALAAKRSELETESAAAEVERANAVKLQTLKTGAEIEEETNKSITARLALLREENTLELQKVSDPGLRAQLTQLEQIKELKLQIGHVDDQIRAAEQAEAEATAAIKDKLDKGEFKGASQKKAAQDQINAINASAIANLQQLAAQYDALAATLGGDFIEKAKAIHAEISKLATPDQRADGQIFKTLSSGVEEMAQRIGAATTEGKNAFKKMTQEIEQDAIRLAIKLATEKWLTPLLQGAGGGFSFGGSGGGSTGGFDPSTDFGDSLPGFAGGGDPTGPSIVGERGPELFFPKGPGTVVPNAALENIGKSGGGKGVPSVTTNIINNSSQPVTARPSQVSYDSEMKQFIIHTVLEDQAQGGMLAQAGQQQS